MKSEYLANLMKLSMNELERFVKLLTDAELNSPGLPDHWSFKDVVGHLGTWQDRLVYEIDQVEAGKGLPEWLDLDAANLEIFTQNEHRTWDEVWSDAERFNEKAIRRIKVLSEDVLNGLVEERRTLGRVIFGNSFMHWIDHIMNCYLERGDILNAERLLQLELKELLTFDSSLATQGIAKYNQACFYAKTSQSEKALVMLREALRLRPDLLAWSREDSDLVNLHGLRDYESLYK